MAIVTVTYLQMLSREAVRSRPCPDPHLEIRETTIKQWQFNRFLYMLVGGDWGWVDKLIWDDAEWKAYAEADSLRTFALYYDGSPAGYFELNSEIDRQVEIAYFGLAPKFIGKGMGGYLLSCALLTAWETNPDRVWVHTCSKDHPAALVNYQARGLQIYKVEHIPL